MALREILLYPDPLLREPAREVETFDDELEALVADMVETMHAAPGVGLAANQVGVTRRVAVVDLSVGTTPAELHVLVNPRIVHQEGEETEPEGCLSIPELTEKVTRPAAVVVEARDTRGQSLSLAAEGWLARAICHEVDHLDGILFVDHLRGLRRERAKRFLRRLTREQAAVEATAP